MSPTLGGRLVSWREPTRLLPFEEVSEGPLEQRRVFATRSDVVRSQASRKQLTIDRLITPDWVNVVALAKTEAGPTLLCVRQYRFGTRQMSLELPAGLVDEGESAPAAALRELREETGYAPREGVMHELGVTFPNAAITSNRLTSFFVPVAERRADLALDEHEELELVGLPLADLDEAVASGHITNLAAFAGLYLAQKRFGDLLVPGLAA